MHLKKDYFKKKNFLERKDHNEVIKLILKNLGLKKKSIKIISNKIIENYKKDNSSVGTLQDSIKKSKILKSISKNKKYQKKLSNILSNKNKSLLVDFNFRIDLPKSFKKEEKKMSLPWHQDFSYYRKKTDLINYDGYVIYISLFKIGHREGSIVIDNKQVFNLQKHKTKYLDIKNKKFMRHNLENYKPKKEVYVNLNQRDALLMNFFCIHRSGKNVSKNVRFTLLLRYKFKKN